MGDNQPATVTAMGVNQPATVNVIGDSKPSKPVNTGQWEMLVKWHRHEEAEHKITTANGKTLIDEEIYSPGLTDKGKLACIEKSVMYSKHWSTGKPRARIVFCSSLLRAVQTVALTFEKPIRDGLKVVVLPELNSFGEGNNAWPVQPIHFQNNYPKFDTTYLGRELDSKSVPARKEWLDKCLAKWYSELIGDLEIILVTHSSVMANVLPNWNAKTDLQKAIHSFVWSPDSCALVPDPTSTLG